MSGFREGETENDNPVENKIGNCRSLLLLHTSVRLHAHKSARTPTAHDATTAVVLVHAALLQLFSAIHV